MAITEEEFIGKYCMKKQQHKPNPCCNREI